MKTLSLFDGDRIPALGLGTWRSSDGRARDAVTEAIAIGYRHIDCASIYGNEAEIGTALRSVQDSGVVSREDLWITSKLWNDAHEPDHVAPALRKTLDDLQLETLDLYLIHWPVVLRHGVLGPKTPDDYLSLEDVPLIETWRAMEACQQAGLCRHIGVSNFSARKLRGIIEGATIRPAMNQVEAHPFLQQSALVAYCRSEGVLVTAYSPLGSPDRPAGMVLEQEPSLLDDPVVVEIADRRSLMPAQVLIAWAINRGTVVIPKSVNPERLRQNYQAAGVELDDADMAALARLDRHHRFVHGAFWEMKGAPYTRAGIWDE
ncbi:MAG: aldo/keto reductase [Planctomycetota bacterium]